MSELENNTEMTDDQVNELYENIQQTGSSDIPMDNGTPTPTETTTQMFKLGDRELTQDDLLSLAEKGQQIDQYTPVINKYKQIDEYAIQNPEWWEHVQNSFANLNQNGENQTEQTDQITAENNLPPELAHLENKITEISEFISGMQQEKVAAQRMQEDKELDSEINGIKEKFPHMDFSATDESGMNLEQKVLKHAQELGTNSFRVAFRDLMHDQLIAKAQESGKEVVTKQIQKNTKLGILGTSDKSVEKRSQSYKKGQSYEDLVNDSLRELGLA